MANNELGRAGARSFSTVLGDNVEIRDLDLSGNKFGDSEAQLLSEALSVSDLNLPTRY